uniref:Uncharacterized protein n=2 Tax=Physcomitrium patens TaxID=3218 RepID=A0A7I4CIM4_PHYPA
MEIHVLDSSLWSLYYKKLSPNIKTIRPLILFQLMEFHNIIDIFVNLTLYAQGLDITLLEAM